VARFAGAVGEQWRDDIGLGEMLAFRIAANHIAMIFHDNPVEEMRSGGMAWISGQLMKPREPDDLGNLRVRVEARQDVAAFRQGVENTPVAYAFGKLEVAPVSGER